VHKLPLVMHLIMDQKIVDEGEADAVVHGGEVEAEEVAVAVVEREAEEEESTMVGTATRRLRINLRVRKARARRGSGLLNPMVGRTLVSGGMQLLHPSNPRKKRKQAKVLLHSECMLNPFSTGERMFSKAHKRCAI